MFGEKSLANKLSLRAILAGIATIVALMSTSLVLAAALGLWDLNVWQWPAFTGAFWTWTYLSWAASVYAGAALSAFASRPTSLEESILHSFLTWAFSNMLGIVFINHFYGGLVGGIPTEFRSEIMLWGAFIGNITALFASLDAGRRISYLSTARKVERVPIRVA